MSWVAFGWCFSSDAEIFLNAVKVCELEVLRDDISCSNQCTWAIMLSNFNHELSCFWLQILSGSSQSMWVESLKRFFYSTITEWGREGSGWHHKRRCQCCTCWRITTFDQHEGSTTNWEFRAINARRGARGGTNFQQQWWEEQETGFFHPHGEEGWWREKVPHWCLKAHTTWFASYNNFSVSVKKRW